MENEIWLPSEIFEQARLARKCNIELPTGQVKTQSNLVTSTDVRIPSCNYEIHPCNMIFICLEGVRATDIPPNTLNLNRGLNRADIDSIGVPAASAKM